MNCWTTQHPTQYRGCSSSILRQLIFQLLQPSEIKSGNFLATVTNKPTIFIHREDPQYVPFILQQTRLTIMQSQRTLLLTAFKPNTRGSFLCGMSNDVVQNADFGLYELSPSPNSRLPPLSLRKQIYHKFINQTNVTLNTCCTWHNCGRPLSCSDKGFYVLKKKKNYLQFCLITALSKLGRHRP